MKPVLVGFVVAAAFWFLMFSPWTAGTFNFWLLMTAASGSLAVGALLAGRKDNGLLYAFQLKWVGIGLASAVILYLVFFVGDRLTTRLFDFAAPQISNIYGTKSQASPLLIGSLLLLWIGPAEEIFWRGFAQHRLQAKSRLWGGYLLTSAVYALVHVWAFNLMLFTAALVCGLFWGWMFMKFKSVWPGLISHAVWDLTIVVLLPIR
jgi:membrane protease YdiL (CAAX protease family)